MARKTLTEDEMVKLRESPYVIKVNEHIINFTTEFKQKFWDACCSGVKPEQAVADLGIDPEVLGKDRINGLKYKIWNDIKAGKGIYDIVTSRKYIDSEITPEMKIKHLEHQLAYKDQEIEFLKKIVSLGREGKGS